MAKTCEGCKETPQSEMQPIKTRENTFTCLWLEEKPSDLAAKVTLPDLTSWLYVFFFYGIFVRTKRISAIKESLKRKYSRFFLVANIYEDSMNVRHRPISSWDD